MVERTDRSVFIIDIFIVYVMKEGLLEASRTEIKSIQGFSVLAMVCLHLFCRFEFENLYTPLIYFAGKPLCLYLAQLSDFCVMGFAFCSGYAHTILWESDRNYYKNRIKSVIQLVVSFWVIVIFFSLLSILNGYGQEMPGSFLKLIGNLLLYKMNYNGAWWYLITYILLVATSPIIIQNIKNTKGPIMILSFIVIYIISYYVRFHYVTNNFVITQLYLYGMTVAEYAIGVYFYEYKIFSKVKTVIKVNILTYISCFVLFILMLLGRTLLAPTLFVAPITGVALILMFHILYDERNIIFRMLKFVGNHSTNIWLIHMFFYQYMFVDLIWKFKYPVLIYIFSIIITISFSCALHKIQVLFIRKINKVIFE